MLAGRPFREAEAKPAEVVFGSGGEEVAGGSRSPDNIRPVPTVGDASTPGTCQRGESAFDEVEG